MFKSMLFLTLIYFFRIKYKQIFLLFETRREDGQVGHLLPSFLTITSLSFVKIRVTQIAKNRPCSGNVAKPGLRCRPSTTALLCEERKR